MSDMTREISGIFAVIFGVNERLFNAWLDCYTHFKLCAVEVCTLGVFFVSIYHLLVCVRSFVIIWCFELFFLSEIKIRIYQSGKWCWDLERTYSV